MGRLGNISGKETANASAKRAGKSWGKWEVT